MKIVILAGGHEAKVDDEDFSLVRHFKWYLHEKRYARASIGGKLVYMHRFITAAGKGMDVDHFNGDGLDSQRANLRVCTHKENSRSMKPRTDGTSRFRGVFWNSQARRWTARIKVDGRQIHIGNFKNEVDAAAAYRESAKQNFKNFSGVQHAV